MPVGRSSEKVSPRLVNAFCPRGRWLVESLDIGLSGGRIGQMLDVLARNHQFFNIQRALEVWGIDQC
jgi:hypothetical protein